VYIHRATGERALQDSRTACLRPILRLESWIVSKTVCASHEAHTKPNTNVSEIRLAVEVFL